MTKQYDAVKGFLDPDIRATFEEMVSDYDGTLHPREYFMGDSALVASNIQLVRVLREAFRRGFVVKE